MSHAKQPLALANHIPVTRRLGILNRTNQFWTHRQKVEVATIHARLDRLTKKTLIRACGSKLTAGWSAVNPDLISGKSFADTLPEKIESEHEVHQKKHKERKEA
ncbi:hypothetical protein AV641_02110 [Pseudomonas fragi]|nr:hypothetical protein AV641_02110 [Pseudomonas fragi]